MLDEIYDLFIDLEATEDQLDFPVLYTNAKTGVAHRKLDDGSTNLQPLFETIVSAIPEPKGDPNGVLQAQVMNLDYSDFLGRIAIGRVFNGTLRRGADVGIAKRSGALVPTRITKLYTFRGLERDETEEVPCGDLVAVAGVEGIQIGESLTDLENPAPLEPLVIDEPTLAMNFTVNTGPLAGREGQWVTSRDLRARLQKELLTNVSLRITDSETTDVFRVLRARRIAARHPDRNHAPRRLRADGRQAGNRGARGKRQETRAARTAGGRLPGIVCWRGDGIARHGAAASSAKWSITARAGCAWSSPFPRAA